MPGTDKSREKESTGTSWWWGGDCLSSLNHQMLYYFLIKVSHKRKDTLDTKLPGLIVFLKMRNLQSLHIDLKHAFDIIMLSMATL